MRLETRMLRARARADRRAGAPVATWNAPRGPRDANGRWMWAWPARPSTSYGSDAERRCAESLRSVVEAFVAARYGKGVSLRELSTRTGVALSVLTGLEQGSAWPKVATVVAVAGALDLEAFLACPNGRAASLVDNDAVDAVVHDLRTAGISWREAALRAGLRPNTVSELADPDRRATASLRTLLALADLVGWRIQCSDAA